MPFEKLTPIEKTKYHKLKEPFLFYDISELGWSRYISAHINYLTKNNKKVSICCSKSREVLYRGFATEILSIPDSYYKKFGHLMSASHHLHDPIKNIDIENIKIISKPFKEKYPEYTLITDYSKFYNQRIFEPYKHSNESELFCQKFRKCIVVFPRCRNSRFSRRNISEENWIKIIGKLCTEFQEFDIISIGGIGGTLNIELPFKNYYNLVPNDDNLDILVTLCNLNKVVVSFGTQSGVMHIATICRSISFIVGHDTEVYNENFTNADIKFWQTIETIDGYKIDNIDKLINDLIDFVNLIKIMKNKFEFFIPLMHEFEYKFIEKFLNEDDILLEWGSGNSTIYFSGLVEKLITIEHDIFYYKQTEAAINLYNIKNIDNFLIQSKSKLPSNIEVNRYKVIEEYINYPKYVNIPSNIEVNRYEFFEEYINYPKYANIKFTKVLIDGRCRKFCALSLLNYIDENVIVFIHDFNHNDVEGYIDNNYFDKILEHYDIIERIIDGRGIVALKKKIS